MTIAELQIQLDIHFDDKVNILKDVASKVDEGFFFVDSEDGHCYLFDIYGNLDDITKVKTLNEQYIKTDIKKIIIPNGVTSIWAYAFNECSSLESVTIGNGVTSIEYAAFRECWELRNVHITDLAKWCSISFSNSYANPLYYAHNLYLNGKKVTELVIPDGVTNIGSHAFRDCIDLTSVMIPNSVMYIEDNAFYNCSSLTNVIIPNSVMNIGNYAFFNCSNLESVTISNGVTHIRHYAFSYCSNLTSIMIPNSVTSIGGNAFYSCSSLTNVTIGNSVVSIWDDTFINCNNLKSLIFKGKTLEQVKKMKNYPFGIEDKSIIKCKS